MSAHPDPANEPPPRRDWLRRAPDASPIYDEIAPGAFLVTCHSGVSLAAVHMQTVAAWVDRGGIPAEMSAFGLQRFQKTPGARA